MLFAEIPGNENIKKEWIGAVRNNKIAHAQLVVGKNGNAKLALALAYAQYLNCESPKENDSCNQCHSCMMYRSLAHPDLHIVFPVLKIEKYNNPISDNFISQWREIFMQNPYFALQDWFNYLGGDNKQGVIYKQEAEEIQRKTTLKRYGFKYRIFVIWMPEKMNDVAANKLLKLIEEPPQGTVFLMVSENPDQLLPTIISRLQRIKTPTFSTSEVSQYLQEKLEIEQQRAQHIATIVDGDLNAAIGLCQEEMDQSPLKDFQRWMHICYKASLLELADWTDEFAKKGRENQIMFLQYATKIIRGCLWVNLQNESYLQLSSAEQEFIRNFSPFIHEKNQFLIFNRIDESIRNIESNANVKILIYELSLQLMKLLKVKRKLAV